jgi:hypothetical protein
MRRLMDLLLLTSHKMPHVYNVERNNDFSLKQTKIERTTNFLSKKPC